ncbi:MAG: hypothetical protein ACPGQS_14510, partial [Bradymonadia bacterium]
SDGGRTCFMVYGNYNCGSAHGRTRLSFAKIDPTEEYEARKYLDYIQLEDEEGEHLKSLSVPVPLSILVSTATLRVRRNCWSS